MSSEDFFLNEKETKKIDFKFQKIFNQTGLDRKTLDEVFDRSTLLSIEKLISDRLIDYIDFPISSGKEGNIFLAITPKKKPVVLKIYRISTSTFKHMNDYIIGDPRFQSNHKSHRDIIYTWTSKEYKNLLKLESIGILAPKPIKKINNVLVMEFIGKDRQAAPMLKDVQLNNPKTIFKQVITSIRKMYQNANLVHCDLSQFNILIHQNKPYIIDLGQGILKDHPMSETYLKRDIHSIVTYFRKYNINENENIIYDKIKKKKEG
ncbi:MAG: serine protein kinase RIO [Bacillota bacterium]|jgi:RIO kinase 1